MRRVLGPLAGSWGWKPKYTFPIIQYHHYISCLSFKRMIHSDVFFLILETGNLCFFSFSLLFLLLLLRLLLLFLVSLSRDLCFYWLVQFSQRNCFDFIDFIEFLFFCVFDFTVTCSCLYNFFFSAWLGFTLVFFYFLRLKVRW